MAVSPRPFPPRKRGPSAGAFVPPNFSGHRLLQSLLLLSQEISSFQPFQRLLNRNSTSIIRRLKLLSVLFEELIGGQATCFSPSVSICFEELYIVLQRIRALIEDCASGSKTWLLMQSESVANAFHELTVDLSTLLDIFPTEELNLDKDVEELVDLIRKQTSDTKAFLEPADHILRSELLDILNGIKREIVPDHSKLSGIFQKLELMDSSSCSEEIENLEDEVQNQKNEKPKSEVIALIGLVRYAKCVLYGTSTPRAPSTHSRSAGDVTVPADFRCPISLELMRDPVVVSTGQTYDRSSINLWIQLGHHTCPKTGQNLARTDLISNRALKNLISIWCREQKIPFEATELNGNVDGVIRSKTALEATKMTASYLVSKLKAAPSMETVNRLIHELRMLAKSDSESRAFISEAGALTLLAKFLGPDHPSLQVNAVTTILNLSIHEANKTRIIETDEVLDGVIEVLMSGATWEAKGNAAATIFSLTGVRERRKKLRRKTRVISGLMSLAKVGPTSSRRDAMLAILGLAGEREIVGKLVEAGVVAMVGDLLDELPEEAVTVLEAVVKRGGLEAVLAARHLIGKLATLLRDGSERAQESAAAALVVVCRRGGPETVAELAAFPGIDRVMWGVMGTGGGRARRKAASLLRIIRRWAAGLGGDEADGYSASAVTSTSGT